VKKIAIAKKIVSTIVGFGTGKIVHDIIANNVPTDNTAQKVSVASASFVIGTMAVDATSSYTDAKIDEIVDWWSKNVTKTSK
jgi:hypothetical protein